MPNDITYWYEGRNPNGEWLRLPRTKEVEAIAHALMQSLAIDERYNHEGKMYGVLLTRTITGETQILKAFSGLLNGESIMDGWVPPIPGREQVAIAEAETLAKLTAIQQVMIALQNLPERQQYADLSREFEQRLQIMGDRQRQRQQQRQRDRQTHPHLAEQFNQQSQRDGMERRDLKRQRERALAPLRQVIDAADCRLKILRQERKSLSQTLQAQMYASYQLLNFLGTSATLQQLMPQGMPTGTGDCCAPKLLHYAATHHLKPLAMAEFWWGATTADKIPGQFYGACAERCQPLMGFLLSGLAAVHLPVLYEDEWLMAIDKPAGLLSVPGRYGDRQDSVLNRLRVHYPHLSPIHRLDRETSGVLLFAKDPQTHHRIYHQFQHRQVHKRYEAILPKLDIAPEGIIALPLWGNPGDRPKQTVDWQRGKPSVTQFQVMHQTMTEMRVEFVPLTGRTHQLRVHALAGLGAPIWGDRLYGCPSNASRLYLHAKELEFYHPHLQQAFQLQSPDSLTTTSTQTNR